ncbi:MAG: hypothetical protein HY506_02085 [Candidatus Yanofskybacteria bacterium]|nr:hypothetical protein [Candidatus Yanofskybacteria bacterium]
MSSSQTSQEIFAELKEAHDLLIKSSYGKDLAWWIKLFAELHGFVLALDRLGLKDDAIKTRLIEHFSGLGFLRVEHFVEEKNILLFHFDEVIKKGGFSDLERKRRFRLVIEAYDALIKDFDNLMRDKISAERMKRVRLLSTGPRLS